jgi:hypothetical protein
MATVKTDYSFSVSCKEEEVQDLGTSRMTHLVSLSSFLPSGTGANQLDRVYSDSSTPVGSPDTLDLLGTLSSLLTGATISFVTLNGIIIRNKSTTSTEVLSIGGGSNPVAGLWGAGGDLIKIGPGGVFMWWDPVDGITPVAGTGDILQIDPGADTIAYDVLLVGQSA